MNIKILTCNLRTARADDGPDSWEHRKDRCARVIVARSPDIICCQETTAVQSDDMAAAFPAYRSFGLPDTPAGSDPVNTILYKADRFGLVCSDGYWLSQTPHVPGSSSWNSACVRLANWVLLEPSKGGPRLRVVNTHLDHISQEAREHQARLIVEDAAAYPDDFCQVLTGDMNCDHTNPAIQTFLAGGWQDTYAAVHGIAAPGFTYHGFKGPGFAKTDAPETSIDKMDWIFTRGALTTGDAKIITDNKDGRYPSDHYFISAVLRLPARDRPLTGNGQQRTGRPQQ